MKISKHTWIDLGTAFLLVLAVYSCVHTVIPETQAYLAEISKPPKPMTELKPVPMPTAEEVAASPVEETMPTDKQFFEKVDMTDVVTMMNNLAEHIHMLRASLAKLQWQVDHPGYRAPVHLELAR